MLHLSNSRNKKQLNKQRIQRRIGMMLLAQPLQRLQTVLRSSQTSSSDRAPSVKQILKICWPKLMQPVNRWRRPLVEIKLVNSCCYKGGSRPGDENEPSFK